MSALYWMTTIAARDRMTEFVTLYQSLQLPVHFMALGRGTAGNEILSLFGLDDAEKVVIFTAVSEESWIAVKKALQNRIHIEVPGRGVAFVIPIGSIGGKRELLYLTQNQKFEKGAESTLQGTNHVMLVAIADQGYNEAVMNAAREAGATGGTVIHAKGSGMNQAEHFFGITLASEKDLVFIVAPTGKKDAIMQSIMENAGMHSKAKAMVFALPVTDVAGLHVEEV